MKIRTTLTVAVTMLTLGVPVATADPDGYQPDAIDRYLANNIPDGSQPQLQSTTPPDAVDRYLRNHPNGAESSLDSKGASGHPDSLAVRPGVIVPAVPAEAAGFGWEVGALGALGGALIVLLAVVGASAMRERRRLVLR